MFMSTPAAGEKVYDEARAGKKMFSSKHTAGEKLSSRKALQANNFLVNARGRPKMLLRSAPQGKIFIPKGIASKNGRVKARCRRKISC